MSDAEQQIIRLLTDLRDAQREELAYRRRVLEESIGLQRRAVRLQRIGLAIILGMLAVGAALFVWAMSAARQGGHASP
jgi:hypothetical protein